MTPTTLHRAASSDGHPLLARSQAEIERAGQDYLRWWNLTGTESAISRQIHDMADDPFGVIVHDGTALANGVRVVNG